MLTEYLFRDTRRLDEYASQINPGLNVIERGKEWTVGLSLSGPKAEGKQTERVRPMTEHEKAQLVLEYLREHETLFEGTENGPLLDKIMFARTPFVHEQCVATRFIAPELPQAPDLAFAFLLCHREICREFVVLVEDDRDISLATPDRILRHYSSWSKWVQRQRNLQQHMTEEELMGRAWRKVVNAPVPPKYEEGKLVSVLLDSQIARQPAETEIFARRLGATPFEPRAIECVYRVRERTYWGNDCCIIIAYPIWIAVA